MKKLFIAAISAMIISSLALSPVMAAGIKDAFSNTLKKMDKGVKEEQKNQNMKKATKEITGKDKEGKKK